MLVWGTDCPSGERGRTVSNVRPEFTSQWATYVVYKCCKWGGPQGCDGSVCGQRSSEPWAALVTRNTSSKAAEAWTWLGTLHVISNVWTFSWTLHAVRQGRCLFFVVCDSSWLSSAPCYEVVKADGIGACICVGCCLVERAVSRQADSRSVGQETYKLH